LTCFVCGRDATTVEHVVPAWLQRRFNLWDQFLQLPNRSTIPYRQLRIPSCRRCNGEVFGALERRVETDHASESDIWKWANKIHYGLTHKDRFLAWDRANRSVKIGDVTAQSDPFERSRHFLHCVSGDFRADPDPFGSVFVFQFETEQDFKFAHFVESSSVCICLGRVGYIVFVEDGQTIKLGRPVEALLASLPRAPRLEDMLFFYAQCLELVARHTLGFDILMGPGFIAKAGDTVVHEVRPIDKNRFRATCVHLGLRWIDTGEL
jgi:hypothetical protein